ncbi:uncharacterized protein [Asterias amurensis]|uniref:uncharacterized protein n=1 Tax=Asterias amurensis TaxID=7602 RepID=UPI003AB1FD0D
MHSWYLPFFILLLTLPNDVSSSQCCPTCSTQSISPLNTNQIQQIENQRDIIKAMEENPQLVYDRVHQIPIVKLTRNQENQIIRNFPWIFNLGLPQGERNISGGSEEGPARRNVAGECELMRRVCQPNPISEPLILALNQNGEVVQLVQIPNQNQYQWVLNEECLTNQEPLPCSQVCCIAQRLVAAMFINLSIASAPFDYARVIVHSCVSYYK